jgi:hypothetical protein
MAPKKDGAATGKTETTGASAKKAEKGIKAMYKIEGDKVSQGHAQLASGVVPDTLWQTTIAGILVVTAASLDTSKNKQF